jgi:hypothetical protein
MGKRPSGKEMGREMETVGHATGPDTGLPFKDYIKDEKSLRQHIEGLEKEYDEREKVISRIMEYGTGIESEKALRMYPTPILVKWDASLEKTMRARAKQ